MSERQRANQCHRGSSARALDHDMAATDERVRKDVSERQRANRCHRGSSARALDHDMAVTNVRVETA